MEAFARKVVIIKVRTISSDEGKMKDESFSSSIGVHCRNCQYSVSTYREINAHSRDQIFMPGAVVGRLWDGCGVWCAKVFMSRVAEVDESERR